MPVQLELQNGRKEEDMDYRTNSRLFQAVISVAAEWGYYGDPLGGPLGDIRQQGTYQQVLDEVGIAMEVRRALPYLDYDVTYEEMRRLIRNVVHGKQNPPVTTTPVATGKVPQTARGVAW
jgi:hypothetical protein